MKTPTIPKLKKKLDLIFAEYIRLRDSGLTCISCDLSKPYLQAGHFYAKQGFDGLRYDESNVNGECPADNVFNESHLIGYSENLLIRIGHIRFAELKLRAANYKKFGHKWSRSELTEKITYYTQQIKIMKQL